MRVPKYRAWVKENKEMLFVRQIDFMFEKVVQLSSSALG